MNFKQRQKKASIPQVNLVPMMDVLMSVLIFFIVTTTVFTGQRLGNIEIPGVGGGSRPETVDPLIVGLDRQGNLIIDNQTVEQSELVARMETYLSQNPEGTIVVKADRQLPYRQVTQRLKEMAAVGGDRVLLAVEKN